MRVHVYEQLMAMQASRRQVMKGARARPRALAQADLSSLATGPAFAADSVVAQIMKIPGAGNGSPTDADWQKVGELCLGPTKANVQPGEFKGIEFSFMGLNNQNLHNFLFRGFLKPWEAYTGAKIKWIDLAQADYNARLQQSIATGTVDFDIIEMGAPFEGDMGVKDLLSEMPDWVKKQIDFDDYVNYLKPPVGTWNGKIHRVMHRQRLPHDEQTHRRLLRSRSRQAMEGLEGQGRPRWGPPKTWQQVQAVTKFLKGKKVKGKEVYGFLDQPKPWGGFRLLFHGEPRDRLCQISRRKELAVRREHEAARQQPGAGCARSRTSSTRCPTSRPTRSTPIPARPPSSSSCTGTGSLLEWWGDIGTVAKTSDTATIGDVLDFDILPGSDDVYNFRKRAVGEAAERAERTRPTWPISAGASM